MTNWLVDWCRNNVRKHINSKWKSKHEHKLIINDLHGNVLKILTINTNINELIKQKFGKHVLLNEKHKQYDMRSNYHGFMHRTNIYTYIEIKFPLFIRLCVINSNSYGTGNHKGHCVRFICSNSNFYFHWVTWKGVAVLRDHGTRYYAYSLSEQCVKNLTNEYIYTTNTYITWENN